jgi:hypothetical protein
MMTYRKRRYNPTILDLGTRWRWSASRPGRFTSGESAHSTNWIGGWVGPRAGLDNVEKRKLLAPAGNRTPVVQPVAISIRHYKQDLATRVFSIFERIILIKWRGL